jgi:hypothetical protein
MFQTCCSDRAREEATPFRQRIPNKNLHQYQCPNQQRIGLMEKLALSEPEQK